MKKNKMFYIFDCLLILGIMVMVLLDTFLIKRTYAIVENTRTENKEYTTLVSDNNESVISNQSQQAVISNNNLYQDENITIELNEYEYLDTVIYVADVRLSSIDYLYSAFADNTYGKNVTDKVSEIAQDNNAILAINGDYYGARNSGYVLRNGVWYRTSVASNSQEDLVIKNDGSFEIINEGEVSAESIIDALQVYSFGPALIEDYEIAVNVSEEVGKAKASNPRTAICEIEPLHYLLIVSDGRTNESEGLSLYELAEFIQQFNVKTAYNLDGGGSSTMVFNGNLINNPTTSGNSIKERSVSDAICIGY